MGDRAASVEMIDGAGHEEEAEGRKEGKETDLRCSFQLPAFLLEPPFQLDILVDAIKEAVHMRAQIFSP